MHPKVTARPAEACGIRRDLSMVWGLLLLVLARGVCIAGQVKPGVPAKGPQVPSPGVAPVSTKGLPAGKLS